ncbi:hypothetical protein FEM03_21250 [Phragmitibacter flavus]|uniref:Addiction module protein n=1 Tax=Phragmitibacter flavus TaxID=2576071 RepID=A0A5R8K8T6_9BACT|nr:addiction module protein [Phragmitibacter flavus]TLD68711.1 hypothetical protein FEM03_21250 [Phragmitibacter flavus]
MATTVEQIKQEIRNLSPAEVDHLLRDLQVEYTMPALEDQDEARIEATWNAEIDQRLREIEHGTVKLIPGEQLEREIDALFVQHGHRRRDS